MLDQRWQMEAKQNVSFCRRIFLKMEKLLNENLSRK